MPTLSPQDVEGMYDMIEALRKGEARERNPLPPGTADRYISQLRSEFEFSGSPPGQSANEGFTGDWTNPDPTPAPWRGEYDMPGNFERQQSMANSMAEDAMLREALGSERKRTKEDDVEGVFALSRYPGVDYAIWGAESGLAPAGLGMGASDFMGDPEDQRERAAKRKRWAKKQRELLGMDRRIGGDEWKSFRRGMKGRGAKQRRQAMRSFLRGI